MYISSKGGGWSASVTVQTKMDSPSRDPGDLWAFLCNIRHTNAYLVIDFKQYFYKCIFNCFCKFRLAHQRVKVLQVMYAMMEYNFNVLM